MKQLFNKLDINDVSKNDYELIFKTLDRNNNGFISIDEFLMRISDNKETHEKLKCFLNKVNDKLLTNSEILMNKIKKLKKRAAFASDKESLEDLDW